MSNLIKNHYNLIIPILILLCIPLFPITVEIIFKFGNIIGSFIRQAPLLIC